MSDFLDQIDVISIAVFLSVMVVNAAGFVFWVNFELRQLRKDSEMGDVSIEKIRTSNVDHLKTVYDMKIQDSRSYAKGLFENQASEIRSISQRMGGVENSLNKIINLLMKPK